MASVNEAATENRESGHKSGIDRRSQRFAPAFALSQPIGTSYGQPIARGVRRRMLSWTGWLVALAAAICATILAADAEQPSLQMAAAAGVCIAITLIAVREHRKLQETGAPMNAIASSTARYLALVWAWAALSVFLTYLLIIDKHWPEWWQFFIGLSFAAIASLAFSALLDRDRATGRSDDTLIKVGRILVQAQLIGMVVGIISLFVDQKFPRAATHADWAGCNILFFGALAITVISLDALRSRVSV